MEQTPLSSTPPTTDEHSQGTWLARWRNARTRTTWLLVGAALLVALGVAAVVLSPGQVPAREGSIALSSDPQGATVFVDGNQVGATPYVLTATGASARHTVVLQLPGYKAWSDTVTVEPGTRRDVNATLDLETASLTINTDPPAAKVRVCADRSGQSPFVLKDLPPGTYPIDIELPSYQPIHDQVVLKLGDAPVRTFSLKPLPAALEVAASNADGATLFVDGQPRGGLPAKLADLPVGKHALRIEKDGQEVWSGDVELKAGQTARVEATIAAPTPEPWSDDLTPGEETHPVAVIIENSADARPQSGLHSAAVVYEALAEGGISRFLAVYQKGESDVIGPVRSARDYFVNIAKEFNAPLVHIGASPGGYAEIKRLGLPNLDETYGDPGFWRSRSRTAPHNAYVSTASVRSGLSAALERTQGSFAGFAFKTEARPIEGRDAPKVHIDYGWNYTVGYEYEPSENVYERYMQGQPHVDAENGEHLRAANVVVMTVDAAIVDDVGRLAMDQVGEGNARIFMDGRVIEGSWRKASLLGATEYFDEHGTPVLFNHGPTWVQLIPRTATLTY